MAKARVVHSDDAVAVIFEGKKEKRPEPSEGRIIFPGGHIAVTRTSEGKYWAHFGIERGAHATPGEDAIGEVVDARIDKLGEHASDRSGAPLMDPDIDHVALLIEPQWDWTRKGS